VPLSKQLKPGGYPANLSSHGTTQTPV
jgi:hypothetical protein